MFREKIRRLINDYGIKQEYIIDLIDSNRVSFPKKMERNDFTPEEKNKILDKYGSLLN